MVDMRGAVVPLVPGQEVAQLRKSFIFGSVFLRFLRDSLVAQITHEVSATRSNGDPRGFLPLNLGLEIRANNSLKFVISIVRFPLHVRTPSPLSPRGFEPPLSVANHHGRVVGFSDWAASPG